MGTIIYFVFMGVIVLLAFLWESGGTRHRPVGADNLQAARVATEPHSAQTKHD